MTVDLNKGGRLYSNKDVGGYLETLYSFTNLSPCAVAIARVLSSIPEVTFKNTIKWRQQFSYSDIRVKQGIKELEDKGFIISLKQRAHYKLNTALFIKTSVKSVSLIFKNGEIIINYEEANI